MKKILPIIGWGLVAGIFFAPKAAANEYLLDRALSVQVGGQIVQLSAGQTLEVLGVVQGNATVRLVLPSGAMGLTSVPLGNMHLKPAAGGLPPTIVAPTAINPPVPSVPPVPPSVPPVPPGVPSPALATSVTATPGKTSTDLALPALKPGWTNLKFKALPAPAKIPKGFDYKFDPTQENFQVYVPRGYDAKKPCGVLGWTNPGDGVGTPHQFEALLDQYQLIAVSAERCGNNQQSERRIGLLVSAILELSKTMAIDQHRLVLSGLSGGGRVSAMGGFVHPEIFCGVVSWCGGSFYKEYPDTSKPNYVSYGFYYKEKNSLPATSLSLAKKNVKFVLLTGSKDFNLGNSRDIQAAMKKEHLQVELIEEPELGHAVGSVETMRRALDFVLGAPSLETHK